MCVFHVTRFSKVQLRIWATWPRPFKQTRPVSPWRYYSVGVASGAWHRRNKDKDAKLVFGHLFASFFLVVNGL